MSIALLSHNLPHPDRMVQLASFSDLFFNYDNARYKSLAGSTSSDFAADADDLKAALREDAVEFIETLARATGWGLDPDELVEDYLARE